MKGNKNAQELMILLAEVNKVNFKLNIDQERVKSSPFEILIDWVNSKQQVLISNFDEDFKDGFVLYHLINRIFPGINIEDLNKFQSNTTRIKKIIEELKHQYKGYICSIKQFSQGKEKYIIKFVSELYIWVHTGEFVISKIDKIAKKPGFFSRLLGKQHKNEIPNSTLRSEKLISTETKKPMQNSKTEERKLKQIGEMLISARNRKDSYFGSNQMLFSALDGLTLIKSPKLSRQPEKLKRSDSFSTIISFQELMNDIPPFAPDEDMETISDSDFQEFGIDDFQKTIRLNDSEIKDDIEQVSLKLESLSRSNSLEFHLSKLIQTFEHKKKSLLNFSKQKNLLENLDQKEEFVHQKSDKEKNKYITDLKEKILRNFSKTQKYKDLTDQTDSSLFSYHNFTLSDKFDISFSITNFQNLEYSPSFFHFVNILAETMAFCDYVEILTQQILTYIVEYFENSPKKSKETHKMFRLKSLIRELNSSIFHSNLKDLVSKINLWLKRMNLLDQATSYEISKIFKMCDTMNSNPMQIYSEINLFIHKNESFQAIPRDSIIPFCNMIDNYFYINFFNFFIALNLVQLVVENGFIFTKDQTKIIYVIAENISDYIHGDIDFRYIYKILKHLFISLLIEDPKNNAKTIIQNSKKLSLGKTFRLIIQRISRNNLSKPLNIPNNMENFQKDNSSNEFNFMILKDILEISDISYLLTVMELSNVSDSEMNLISKTLLKLFDNLEITISIADFLIISEFQKVESPLKLFEKPTLACNFIDNFLIKNGKDLLRKIFSSTIRDLSRFEFNPSRSELTNLTQQFHNIVEKFFQVLPSFASQFPTEIVEICKTVYHQTQIKFPNQEDQALATFILNRFFSHALISPKSFDIVDFFVSESTANNLKIFTSSLKDSISFLTQFKTLIPDLKDNIHNSFLLLNQNILKINTEEKKENINETQENLIQNENIEDKKIISPKIAALDIKSSLYRFIWTKEKNIFSKTGSYSIAKLLHRITLRRERIIQLAKIFHEIKTVFLDYSKKISKKAQVIPRFSNVSMIKSFYENYSKNLDIEEFVDVYDRLSGYEKNFQKKWIALFSSFYLAIYPSKPEGKAYLKPSALINLRDNSKIRVFRSASKWRLLISKKNSKQQKLTIKFQNSNSFDIWTQKIKSFL